LTKQESNIGKSAVSTSGQKCTPAEMSLLSVCANCNGKCCVGRTLITDTERHAIMTVSGRDALHQWSETLHYLERGPCPYLRDGRCSVQIVKPFVCLIFPLVPRVLDGVFWLVSVGECDAATHLSPEFIRRARKLAQTFFAEWKPEDYEAYWNANKIGDFDETHARFIVPVFDGGDGS
jgi:Fe-S-cluster containining protein